MKVDLEAEGGRQIVRIEYEEFEMDDDANLEWVEVEAEMEMHCDSNEENFGMTTG